MAAALFLLLARSLAEPEPVVPLPTSTATFTTTPPFLRPMAVANLEPGLVGELFDFDKKTTCAVASLSPRKTVVFLDDRGVCGSNLARTVAVIDHSVHHWGVGI